jgi:hypothetical protein
MASEKILKRISIFYLSSALLSTIYTTDIGITLARCYGTIIVSSTLLGLICPFFIFIPFLDRIGYDSRYRSLIPFKKEIEDYFKKKENEE